MGQAIKLQYTVTATALAAHLRFEAKFAQDLLIVVRTVLATAIAVEHAGHRR